MVVFYLLVLLYTGPLLAQEPVTCPEADPYQPTLSQLSEYQLVRLLEEHQGFIQHSRLLKRQGLLLDRHQGLAVAALEQFKSLGNELMTRLGQGRLSESARGYIAVIPALRQAYGELFMARQRLIGLSAFF